MRTRQVVAFAVLAAGLLAAGGAPARVRHAAPASDNGVPYLDVKGSCTDAQKFSTGDEKKTAYSGCLQDEMNAKAELAKRWGDFKAKDRSNCVEQSRNPSPSYVEVLTCLEMDTDAIRNSSRPMPGLPPIGGPVAPGLTTGPASSTSAPSAPQPQ